MALFNYASKEITLKVVYYGPGLSGKTTNLQYLHEHLEEAKKNKLLSLATETDRTLFFDFLPMDLGTIGGFKIKFQLYTVPGQVRYDATRRLVLKGADAVVFVADSQKTMRDANLVSFENMKENLVANNLDPATVMLILQYNKRDLPGIMSIDELNRDLNERHVPFIEAAAVSGRGVHETFEAVTKLLVEEATRKQKMYAQGSRTAAATAPQAAIATGTTKPQPLAAAGSPPPPSPTAPKPVTPQPVSPPPLHEQVHPESQWLSDARHAVESHHAPPQTLDDFAVGTDIASVSRALAAHIRESRARDEEILRVLREIRDGLRR